MSALMEAVSSVLGSDVDKAKARAESVSSQLDAAKAKLGKAERTAEEATAALASGEGDPEKLTAAIVKAEEDARPLRRAVEALTQAKAVADAALARVLADAERDALAAELRPLEAAIEAAVRDFDKHLGPLGDAIGRAFASDSAAVAIRARLELPPASTLWSDLNDVLRQLNVALVEKHDGRGIGSHEVHVPFYSPSITAPTARRLGLIG